MAPNKKKKKPASNPARGFATTSIASKPKVVDDVQESNPILPNQDLLLSDVGQSHSSTDKPGSQFLRDSSKELHELSPEELESQLEESDIQLLLEKNGEKSKKDAFRQVSKLRAERRMLRPQAQHLNTLGWLPPELMQQVVHLLRTQYSDVDSNVEYGERQSVSNISEDDMVIKLWTLKQVLFQTGFSQERTNLAVCHLLTKDHPVRSLNFNTGKDYVWGLEDALDWLTLVCESEEMPGYEPPGGKDHSKRLETPPIDGLVFEAGKESHIPE